MDAPLNVSWMDCNTCFGCGKDNELGLQISVFRDPDNTAAIRGEFVPKPYMGGFPGILHGGIIYTALDCMATWAGMVLRPKRALWVLRSSQMKYHRPAMAGNKVLLAATIEVERPEDDMSPILVTATARDPEGQLLVEGVFKPVPITLEKFAAATGITDRSSGWCQWVEKGAPDCCG